MPEKDAWDLGGGGESFAFDRIGDEVEGFITDMAERQGTNMQTNEPEWWDKEHTRPIMLTLVTLQTNLREGPKDHGLRTVTLAGSKKPNPDGTKSRMCAARTAVLAVTGGTAMEPGAWFKMRFSSEGVKTRVGFNAPKYFEAWYRSPVHDLDGNNTTAPANQISESSQAGANWPSSQGATTGPAWANTGTTTTNPGATSISQNLAQHLDLPSADQYPPGAPQGEKVTAAAVAGVRRLGANAEHGEEMVVQVFGADYQSRIVG